MPSGCVLCVCVCVYVYKIIESGEVIIKQLIIIIIIIINELSGFVYNLECDIVHGRKFAREKKTRGKSIQKYIDIRKYI